MKKMTPAKTAQEESVSKSEEQKNVAVAEGLQKTYLKDKEVCRVVFFLPEEAAPDARKVAVVGDFNGWDQNANIMKKQKDGTFQLVLELPTNHEYRFKYLIDGTQWENDWCADKYVNNEFGGEDSVIQV